MTNLLDIRSLSKSYGSHVALSNLDLSITPGKIVGLLGPNGSGKTTLIKLINGLLQPDYGNILIIGQKPSAQTKHLVSYLPDATYLQDNMKVSDLLNLFQDCYVDFDYGRAITLLADLDINPASFLKNLSKGNKEKVQLILVMSRRAKLYILDEPIGGVDPAARDYILRTIINNYSPDSSVIISTHLINDIEPILDEVVFLKKGQLILHGNTDDLRQEHGKSIDALFRDSFKI